MALILAVNQGLMLAIFPVLPNNDTVSYVEFGHMSDAKRPVDHYAPPQHIPSVTEIPNVEAWRQQIHPTYGYPWMFLDLPQDWASNLSWVTKGIKPPLATDRLVPTNLEWDNSFPMGMSLYFDLIMLVVPATARAFVMVLMNHVFVIATSLLLWGVGCELGWVRAGWLSGLVYGLAFAPGVRAQELMTEPLFTLLDFLALYLVLRGDRRNRSVLLAAGGAALAMAFAVRPVALLQPLVVGAALVFTTQSWREWLIKNAVFGVPFALLCLLVLVHNWSSYGRLSYSTGLGRHLFNRVVTVDRGLDLNDDSTKLILDLASRPRLGGDDMHPYQRTSIDVYKSGSCWAIYWMLRWQGMSVEQADGYMRKAALAAIRKDPTGYLKRSVGNVLSLGRDTFPPFIITVADPQAYANFITRWFIPQFHAGPYNWVGAQWRIFKEEIPLYDPPQIFATSQRRSLVGFWNSLPRVLGVGFYAALVGAAIAVWRARQDRWIIVGGWYMTLLIVPAILQAPNSRYGEPALPAGLLLVLYGLASLGAAMSPTLRQIVGSAVADDDVGETNRQTRKHVSQ